MATERLTGDTIERPSYRQFYTGDAVRRYAELRGIPVCMALTDALRTPCPLDFCVTGTYDSSKDTPEGRASEERIQKKLKWL